AAPFRALTIIEALRCGREPRPVDAAGNGIDLDAERWHREGMYDVRAGGDHAYSLVHRHHHLVIHREQSRLVLLALTLFEHQRIEFESAVVRVAVAPEPLFAGRFHRQIGSRDVELEEQKLE